MSPALAEPPPPVRREAAHIARRRRGHGLLKAPPAEPLNDRDSLRRARRLAHDQGDQ